MRYIGFSKKTWLKWSAVAALLVAVAFPARAVERSLTIKAPESVKADQLATVVIEAHTDASGEQVGFLQVEKSVDGGLTWEPVCYLDQCGAQVRQVVHHQAGKAGTQILIRARAAFRDGLAGDVDYRGAAIMWQGNWKEWESPPAKRVVIKVLAPVETGS